jgi:hypothetical protein
MNKEEVLKMNEISMAAFVAKLGKLNATTIPHGAAIMPRAVWAQGMVSALIAVGVVKSEADAEKVQAVLASDLGNSSQLGAILVKNGTIKQQEVAQAASSFADEIAKLAAQ